MVGSLADSAAERTASDFTEAWARGDMRAMHGLLTDSAQERYPLERFRRAYERAGATATLTSLEPGDADAVDKGDVKVPLVLGTRVFGQLRGELEVPVSDEACRVGAATRVPRAASRRAAPAHERPSRARHAPLP